MHVSPRTAAGHPHVTAIGVGLDTGNLDQELTAEQAYLLIESGDRFFTQDPSSGEISWARAVHCCGLDTLIVATSAV